MHADAALSAPPRLSSWRWVLDVLFMFFISRLLLAGFLLWAQNALFDYPNAQPLSIANRWDAQLYLSIARDGYFHADPVTTTTFFPLYPLLVRGVASAVQSYEWAALVVSNLSLLGAMLAIYRLIADENGDARLARRTLLYMLVFPASFYFSAGYTESLLVFTGAMSVLCSRRRQWGWAIFWCALASASRTVGVLFVGYIALEWARSHGWRLEDVRTRAAWRGLLNGFRTDWLVLVALPVGALGLLVFMRYLGDSFGNPTMFSAGQIHYGNTLGPPFSLFFRDLPYILFETQQGMYPRYQGGTNYALWFLALATVVPVWRRLGSELAVLTAVLLVSLAAVSNMSLGRYVISAFPVFIGLACWARRPAVDRVLTVGFVALQAGLLLTWLRGAFVA